jgi:hypothetical protein
VVVEEGMECFIVDYEWYGVRGESERRKGIERGVLIRMGIKRGEIWEFIMGGWAFKGVVGSFFKNKRCRDVEV